MTDSLDRPPEPQTMTSAMLNDAIRGVCDSDLGPHGKAVPYIGWVWREVDFDAPDYSFGIIPGGFKGFMENNKWGYDCTRPTTPEEWANIKTLLRQLVAAPNNANAGAVWDAIQAVDGAPPPQCDYATTEAGLPLRCNREAGHEGEHTPCLNL